MKLSKQDIQQRQRVSSGILTEDEVRRIKVLLSQGVSRRELAAAYCVSKGTISAIARGDTWGWVTAEPPAPSGGPMPSQDEILASQQRLAGLLAADQGSGRGDPSDAAREQRGKDSLERREKLAADIFNSDTPLDLNEATLNKLNDDIELARITDQRRKKALEELDDFTQKGDPPK